MRLPLIVVLFAASVLCQSADDDDECEAEPTCPTGWTLVNRQIGGWCIQVNYSVRSQSEAEALCNTMNATLSGAESSEERLAIAQLGMELMATAGQTGSGSIRMGFHRCDFTGKWIVSDRHTVGFEALGWAVGEPANEFTETLTNMNMPKNCVAMCVESNGGACTGSIQHGEFYTIACHTNIETGFMGFLCGQLAV